MINEKQAVPRPPNIFLAHTVLQRHALAILTVNFFVTTVLVTKFFGVKARIFASALRNFLSKESETGPNTPAFGWFPEFWAHLVFFSSFFS